MQNSSGEALFSTTLQLMLRQAFCPTKASEYFPKSTNMSFSETFLIWIENRPDIHYLRHHKYDII